MPHTVRTYDNSIPAVCRTLKDVISIDFTKGATGGPLTGTLKLNRRAGRNYIDVWFGYYIEIVWEDGDVVWQGTISQVPQTLSDSGTYDISAVGDLFLLSAITGTWAPNYPASTSLRTIIVAGLATVPGITTNTTAFPDPGVSVVYTPQNTTSFRDHLNELIKYGDSSSRALYWQVINRVFYTFSRPFPLTTYDYKVSALDCATADIGINGDNFFTRVSVRWHDAIVTHISPYNNLSQQTKYGFSFGTNNPAGTRLAYIKEPSIIDITGHGNLTQSQSDQIGNTLLNKYSSDGVRITASKITIQDGQALRSYNNSGIINLSKALPAKVLFISNIPGSSGTLSPDTTSMFIGQVHFSESYNEGIVSQQLELSAEEVIDPANVLAALIAQLPKEAA